ncbi:MAG: bifunctional tetrahydrofolate synthase/dihydrofolate synthase [Gammaproteobacteria bacterium]|nr:bifunctional tetrahydrofolate synthase/dihydrofolate synthase [Gammaproteobacteria bacterium]
MRPTTLAQWLNRIESCHPEEIELGLERVGEVAGRLDLPGTCTVTVAGTNGKGSVVAFLEAMLGAAGYRVAAYTSPHLLAFNERVRLGGVPVDDAALCAAFARVEAARGAVPLTYFEYATLAALCVFADDAPDVRLLEVGLGGRLDAVNIVDADLAVVTPVDLDHAAWLGDDRETIGREKAGILRPGRPAISADPDPPASLVGVAAALGAPLHVAGRDYDFRVDAHGWRWSAPGRVRTSLPRPALFGRHQFANAAAALMALHLLAERFPVGQDAVRRGLLEARLPGRFEVHPGPVETILDVAHNPHGTRALAESLAARPTRGRTLAVVAMRDDKAVEAALAPLVDGVTAWYLAPLPAPGGADPVRLAGALEAYGATPARLASVAEALRSAHADAAEGDRVVVFGSFHTVAAALRAGWA